MSEKSEKKLAHRRLQMLKFAKTLGNITEACRKMGISRSQFYEYKKRYLEHGLEGLKDLPPIHKSHPQTDGARSGGADPRMGIPAARLGLREDQH